MCNARCPQCPRNYNGYPHNDGYTETNLTLAQTKKIFSESFIEQLHGLLINGNYGDIVMNKQAIDIITYFRMNSPRLQITINTNGSAQKDKFWKQLAELGCYIEFALDGLSDTHTLYRQNTNWHTVIKNAQTFISAGGNATWKFIKFKHNQHQIQDCKRMSEELGFKHFYTIDSDRDQGPVYDRQGKLTHTLGDYVAKHDTVFPALEKRKGQLLFDDIAKLNTPKTVDCNAKKYKSVYVTATGEVYPCCWLGFYPKTNINHATEISVLNKQLLPMIHNNNALEHDLEESIAWFNRVEQSWSCSTYQDGKLIKCDQVCGK